MKLITLLSVCLAMALPRTGAQEAVRPILARKFGQPILIQGEFIDKSNDYYSQNCISEPYALMVYSVDGKKLAAPVYIEYRLEIPKRQRFKVEKRGVMETFEAYESIYQPPTAKPWSEGLEQGSAFYLAHVLYIRPTRNGAKAPLQTPASDTPAAGAPVAPPSRAADR